jgi:dTDP-4-dehydrorhamnose 3,5-epimerase
VIFEPMGLSGVFLITPELRTDERGAFARTYCADEFRANGLDPQIAQCSISFNPAAGTLRGMHYQVEPYAEVKLVRCTRGAIYDVVIDLRPESPTYCRWVGAELTADNRRALYVPKGLAHGFLTLAEDSEVFYQISVPYQPGAGAGVRWDDPTFGVTWPFAPRLMAERDATYPTYRPVPVGGSTPDPSPFSGSPPG